MEQNCLKNELSGEAKSSKVTPKHSWSVSKTATGRATCCEAPSDPKNVWYLHNV